MKFADYQDRLLAYIEGLEEDGEDSLDFLNNLMFAEGENYGDYQCDICGHPLKYAMVLNALYIERVCITAHPDNDLFIGTTCFDKLTKLAWLRKKLTAQYDEWRKAITALKTGDKETAKGIMCSVKAAKDALKKQREEEQADLDNFRFEMRLKQHAELLATDETYARLFRKYGYTSKDETDDEGRRFYEHSFAAIQTDNEFLNDLFENAQKQKNGLSDKQRYWFNKLAIDIENKPDPKFAETLKLLATRVRLGTFDQEFVESMYNQSQQRQLSEKQCGAVEKLAHKYRKQMEAMQE